MLLNSLLWSLLSDDFKCPAGYTKCPGSYCLALSLVCDGTADCPYNEDEYDCGR